MVMPLAGCATNGAVINAGYCDVAQPILVSKKDELTEGTARQILSHNETWKSICRK
jgi:hypothetical protein